MSEAFASIRQGLTEAIKVADGQEANALVHKISSSDVRVIQEKPGMTQAELAATFGFDLAFPLNDPR